LDCSIVNSTPMYEHGVCERGGPLVLARRGALVSTSTLVFSFFLFFLDGENPLSVALFLRIWGDRRPLILQSDTGQFETSGGSIVEIRTTRLDIFDRRVYFRNAHPPTNKSQQSLASPSLPNHRGGVLLTHTPPLRNALPER